MKTNPTHPGTYAGQPAKIALAFTSSGGRRLYALTTPGGTVATAWDRDYPLRRFADQKLLKVS